MRLSIDYIAVKAVASLGTCLYVDLRLIKDGATIGDRNLLNFVTIVAYLLLPVDLDCSPISRVARIANLILLKTLTSQCDFAVFLKIKVEPSTGSALCHFVIDSPRANLPAFGDCRLKVDGCTLRQSRSRLKEDLATTILYVEVVSLDGTPLISL